MTILLATNNPSKVAEIRNIFQQGGHNFVSLAELGLHFEAAETGNSFEANAIQKATETLAFLQNHGHTNITVFADDSGLCIDALGGLPGVDSANYMGRETAYSVRNTHLIGLLGDTKNRAAHFACVIACAFPCGEILTTVGYIHGEIAVEPCGNGGFGYDPIFFLPSHGKTTAQLSLQEKSEISHRGQALRAMFELLNSRQQSGNTIT